MEREPRRCYAALTGLCVLILAAATVNAHEIRVDFGDGAVASGNWNVIGTSSTQIANLIDYDTGSFTGIQMDLEYTMSDTGAAGWSTATPGNWAPTEAAGDALTLTGSYQIVFSNMDKGLTYQVELISYDNFDSFNEKSSFQVNAQDFDGNARGLVIPDPYVADENSYTQGNWLIWYTVLPSGGAGPEDPGSIVIQASLEEFGDLEDDFIPINAVRLFVVPEPTTMSLLILGGLAMLRRRR